MTEALVVSNLVLWALVVVLAVVVVALTRQIGLLHERIAPAGALALSGGPAVGDLVPTRVLPALDGEPVTIGGPDPAGRRTLVFFLSPTCPVCRTLLPTVARVAADQAPPVRVVYASDGPSEDHAAYADAHGLPRRDYVVADTPGLDFAVAKLPYAALLDPAGRLRARGIVNTREHLESLFEADRLDAPSVQAWLGERSEGAAGLSVGTGGRAS